ncbi:MAG: hypothetical protein EAZ71_12315 [Verrucomicrobia bacterium]|nr:MAG: hypothetical protein EAZ71_12315 [Verrucomicrobiota bacterium]
MPVMKPALFVFSLLALSLPSTAGELPQLTVQPWIGKYAGYERRSFQFSVGANGEGVLLMNNDKGKPMGTSTAIRFQPLVEETLPDGRSFSKSPSKGGWEAVTPANAKAEIITYRGTVGGGARFEVNFELDGDEIIGGGRIIDKAGVTNPLAFKLRIHMPDIYYFEKSTAKRANLAKKDRVDLLRADGKKLKLDLLTPLDAESQKINGTGMTKARVDLAGYKGGRFDFESGENATFEFWNKAEEPLIEGFALGWRPDPAKDRDGKARFTLKVR